MQDWDPFSPSEAEKALLLERVNHLPMNSAVIFQNDILSLESCFGVFTVFYDN